MPSAWGESCPKCGWVAVLSRVGDLRSILGSQSIWPLAYSTTAWNQVDHDQNSLVDSTTEYSFDLTTAYNRFYQIIFAVIRPQSKWMLSLVDTHPHAHRTKDVGFMGDFHASLRVWNRARRMEGPRLHCFLCLSVGLRMWIQVNRNMYIRWLMCIKFRFLLFTLKKCIITLNSDFCTWWSNQLRPVESTSSPNLSLSVSLFVIIAIVLRFTVVVTVVVVVVSFLSAFLSGINA